MSASNFNPYVGLRPFQADENLLFFGRDQQTLELLQRLHQHRFVAVVGGSGSGKSSLIRAGLIPALKGGYLVEDSSKWFITTMKPGSSPVYNLAETLLRQVDPNATEVAISELVNKIKRERTSAILNLLSPLRKEKNANFFLLIDQFEELFRFSMEQQDSAKKTQAIDFVNLMLDLSKQKVIPFYVVLTMRSDFIGDCAQFRHLPEAMNKSQYLVPRITRQQLKKIIEGPARLYGGKFNPAMTTRLINDLEKVKDELPLLQHTLMRMWDYEVNLNKSGELDFEDYNRIGGIENALSLHATEALEGMSKEDLEITKELFQALTAIDDNGRKIRRPLLLSDLRELTGASEEKLLGIIDNFIRDKRSFLIVEKAGEKDQVIDISHESLIRQWKQLGTWVDEENEAASHYLQLVDAYQRHKLKNKDYLTGTELSLALDWREKFQPSAVWANRYKAGFEECMGYLEASHMDQTRLLNLEKSRRKKLQVLAIIVIGLIVISTFFIIQGQEKSHRNKVLANNEKALQLHFRAKEVEDSDPTIALRLEEEAIKLYEYPEFRKSVSSLIHNRPLYKIIALDSSAITSIDVSLTGENIVAGHENGYVSVWNDEGQLLTKFRADETYVYAVLFTPDGKSILTGSFDGTTRLWDLTGKLKLKLEGHTEAVFCIALSPDGKSIVTASLDKTLRLWDLKGNFIREFIGHQAGVKSVTYSPDGRSILSGSFDKTVRIWDVKGNLKTKIIRYDKDIYSVAYSPDEKSILIGSWYAWAERWDLEGRLEQKFEGHWGTIFKAIYSKNGESILTCSFDNTIRLWDTNGGLLKEFLGHKGQVNSIAFTPDGKSIISGSRDGTIRLWSIDGITSTKIVGFQIAVRSVNFAPDGNSILTGSGRSADLWDLEGKQLRKIDATNRGVIYSAAYAPNGQSILTGSADGFVRIWNLDGTLKQEIGSHDHQVRSVAFAPDGKSVLSGSWDKTVTLWDLKGGLLKNISLEKGVTSVAFAPDGKSVLIGTFGKSILWNLEEETTKEIAEPKELFVNGVAFQPQGNLILTGSNDHVARLWNMDGEIVTEFKGTRGAIRSVAFAPDGKSIMTGSAGGIARIWDLDGNILDEFKGNNGTVFSVAYAPDNKSIVMGSQREAFIMKRIQLEEFLKSANIEPLSEAQKKEYGIKD